MIPCSTCIKRGSPEKCRVDDEGDRPSQPFAQARELEAVRDRVQKLEQLICMLAPVQARSLGLIDANSSNSNSSSIGNNNSFQGFDFQTALNNLSSGGAGAGGPQSASPTNLSFGNINAGGANNSNNPFLSASSSNNNAAIASTSNASVNAMGTTSAPAVVSALPTQAAAVAAGAAGKSATNRQSTMISVKQQQDSDSELDEDEEGEDGREAEKAAFALESIAVAGRPSAVSSFRTDCQINCECT